MSLSDRLRTAEGDWILALLSAPLDLVLGVRLPPNTPTAWRIRPDHVFRSPERHRQALAGRVTLPTPDEQEASSLRFPDPHAIEVDGYQLWGSQWYAKTEDGRSYPVTEPPDRLVCSLPDDILETFHSILEEPLTLEERGILWDLLADLTAHPTDPPPIPAFPSPPIPDELDPADVGSAEFDVGVAVREAYQRFPTSPRPEVQIWERVRQPWTSEEVRRAFSDRRFQRLVDVVGDDPDLRRWIANLGSSGFRVVLTPSGDVETNLPTGLARLLGLSGTAHARQTQSVTLDVDVPALRSRIVALIEQIGSPATYPTDRATRRQHLAWNGILVELAQALRPGEAPTLQPASLLTQEQVQGIATLRQHIRHEVTLAGARIQTLYRLPDGRVWTSLHIPKLNLDLGFVLPLRGGPLPAPADFAPTAEWTPIEAPPDPTSTPALLESFRDWKATRARLTQPLTQPPDLPPSPPSDPPSTNPTDPAEVTEHLWVGPLRNPPGGPPIPSRFTPGNHPGTWKDGISAAIRILQRKPIELDVGYDNPAQIGCGSFGCAYALHEYPGWVVKVTGDERDALAWAHIHARGGVLGMPRAPRVWVFPRELPGEFGQQPITIPNYLYGYVQQLAKPLYEIDHYFFGQAIRPDFHPSRRDSMTLIPGVAQAVARQAILDHELDPTERTLFLRRVDRLLQTVADLGALGIWTDDLRAGNIGLSPDESTYWIYDLGMSAPPPTNLPLLGEDLTIPAFRTYIEGGLNEVPITRASGRITTLPASALEDLQAHESFPAPTDGSDPDPLRSRVRAKGPTRPVRPAPRPSDPPAHPDQIDVSISRPIREGVPRFHVTQIPTPLLTPLTEACAAGHCTPPTPAQSGGWILEAHALRFLISLVDRDGRYPITISDLALDALSTAIPAPDPCGGPACVPTRTPRPG